MYRLDVPSFTRALTEALVAYLALSVVGWLLHNVAFNGAIIHPYLAVVMFMAIRYSLGHGVMAAALATAFLWLGNLLRYHGVDFLQENDKESVFLFICGSIAAGLMTDATRKKLQGLRLSVAEQGEQIFHLAEKNQVLDVANQELRKRIVGEEATLSTFHNVALRLAVARLDDIYLAILDLVVEYTGAERCSLYLLEDNLLRLKEERGHVTPPEERVVRLGFDLLSRAVTERKLVSFKDLRGTPEGAQHLLALPILAASDANVLGVLSIEKLPFVKFTVTNTRLLSVLANWGGEAIYTARHGLRMHAVEDVLADCLTPLYFKRRLHQEILRTRRSLQRNFGVTTVTIDEPKTKDALELVERAVSMVLAINLQETDVVGHLKDGEFAIILFHLKEGSVAAVHERLSQQLTACLPLWLGMALSVRLAHADYGATDDVEALIREAEQKPQPVPFHPFNPIERATTALRSGLQASVLMERKQYREAIELLQAAVSRSPLDSELRHQLIEAYLATRQAVDFQQALKEYAIIQNRQKATFIQEGAT
jgi:GGDEF domain-containing protein